MGCCNKHNHHSCVKVENHPSLIKDNVSKAIISVDDKAYQAALSRKNKSKKLKHMENDISELKIMMATLIQKLDK